MWAAVRHQSSHSNRPSWCPSSLYQNLSHMWVVSSVNIVAFASHKRVYHYRPGHEEMLLCSIRDLFKVSCICFQRCSSPPTRRRAFPSCDSLTKSKSFWKDFSSICHPSRYRMSIPTTGADILYSSGSTDQRAPRPYTYKSQKGTLWASYLWWTHHP